MALSAEEILIGAVAYFDVALLVNDSRVRYSEHGAPFRNGPFVCLQIANGESLWLQITGVQHRNGLRLELLREWRTGGGPGRWQDDPQFIHDARKPVIGPNEAFIEASLFVDNYSGLNRPLLLPPGVESAIDRVRGHGCATL